MPLTHQAPPPLSGAEEQSGAGRSLSPTINSGISFSSSGSQRGHSEGAGAERDGGRRKRKSKSKYDREGGEARKQADRQRGEAVIGITQLCTQLTAQPLCLLPPDAGKR